MNSVDLVRQYGSPLYVYNLAMVRTAYQKLKHALPDPSQIYYSLKANAHPRLVAQLIALGCGCDICSTGELQTVLQCDGYNVEHMLYTGPGKTRREILFALQSGIQRFSIESLHDMIKIVECAEALSTHVELVLRINPESSIAGAGLTMSGIASQFGIDAQAIRSNRHIYQDSPYATFIGSHIYIGSNTRNIEKLLQTLILAIKQSALNAQDQGSEPLFLDLGGGFCHEFARPAELPDYTSIKAPLEATLDDFFPQWRAGKPRVIFEAGRYLTAACGSLICSVEDIKQSKGQVFVVLDTGINHLGGMAGLKRLPSIGPVFTLSKEHETSERWENVSIVGPLCTPLDCLARLVDIPKVEVGDVLTIPNVGAYGLTASLLAFLSRDAPVEVVLDGDTICHVSQLHVERKISGGFLC